MQKVHDFLKKAKTYFLATEEGSKPKCRPFGTVDIFNGKLLIQTGKSKDVYKQMKSNMNVEISACDPGGDWIRIEAQAVEYDHLEARIHMLEQYPELKEMYAADDGNSVVFAIVNAKATLYSFTHPPEIIEF